MAHGIMEHDKGYVGSDKVGVVASTWHGLPQYICLDTFVPLDKALIVADYEIRKEQLFRAGNIPVDAFALVRGDTNATLVPSVGNRFTVVDNKFMVNFISEHLLGVYPDLKIESVGTLWNGATFFLNLKVQEFTVKGDKSPTITNLMYANPLGKGAYVSCAHNTRIVCQNTERIAEAQGIANQSLKKFRHTRTAADRINGHMLDLAELKLHLKKHEAILDHLASQEMDTTEVDAFLDKLFPEGDKDGKAKTIAENSRAAFMEIFDGAQKATFDNPFTKYAFYNAYTDMIDHASRSRNADVASIAYDGIMGIRADKKQRVLQLLTA